MKKFIFVALCVLLSSCNAYGQYIQDPRIDSVVNLVSQQQISKFMRELTGDTNTMVGGVSRLIFSRYYNSPGNIWAAQYIYEKFQSFGLKPYYHVIDSLCRNVIAIKPGTKYPNQKYIIGGHYDNALRFSPEPGPLDTVHGADDDASGVCAVLEAARLLANINFDYTIVFIAWDEEEQWMHGSTPYADTAFAKGDSIRSYINVDMCAYDYNTNKLLVYTNTNSLFYAFLYSSLYKKYSPWANPVINLVSSMASDIQPFWDRGYLGIFPFEFTFNPFYHTINDKFSNMNMAYTTAAIKAVIANLMVFGLHKNAYFNHRPLESTYDTSSRSVTVIIKFPDKLSIYKNSPHLYYKCNNESFYGVKSYYRNLDTFKFMIPGKPSGSLINYYFAAQDPAGSFICTYPTGGTGINPPGTIPPETFFSYEIYSDKNVCSGTLPKQILDNQMTLDTITINQPGYIVKASVNLSLTHQNDGDLLIQLLRSGVPNINLSQRNGQGGQNYFGTIFDDSAAIPITQGVPPFYGTFKPQSPLGALNNLPLSGSYILRVYDVAAGNQGSLASWCMMIQVKTTISAEEEEIPVRYELSQNYPNPFNSSTRINYSIPKSTNVEIKIYDILGREVRTLVNEYQTAGNYVIMFNAGELGSGVYFYTMKTKNFGGTKKLLILK